VQRAVLDELGGQELIDWSRVVDATAVRAKTRRSDRSESGGSRQAGLEDPRVVRRDRIAVDGGGLGGQHQRAYGVQPLVRAIPPVRSRRGPRRCKPGKVHLRLTKLRVWGAGSGHRGADHRQGR
jgi:hypothetical protein